MHYLAFRFTPSELALFIPLGVIVGAFIALMGTILTTRSNARAQRLTTELQLASIEAGRQQAHEALTFSRTQAFDERLWDAKRQLYTEISDLLMAEMEPHIYNRGYLYGRRQALDELEMKEKIPEYYAKTIAELRALNETQRKAIRASANKMGNLSPRVTLIAQPHVQRCYDNLLGSITAIQAQITGHPPGDPGGPQTEPAFEAAIHEFAKSTAHLLISMRCDILNEPPPKQEPPE